MTLNYTPRFSPEYLKYIKSEKWKKRAKAARKRAGYRCELCGRKKQLSVHHISYVRLGRERKEDLLALCESCHMQIIHKLPKDMARALCQILVLRRKVLGYVTYARNRGRRAS